MQEVTEQVGQSKTKAEIGEGDKVIRRTEKQRWESPLMGEVKSVLDNGKLLVRWEGGALCYWRDNDGKTQVRPACAVTGEKPSALLPATETNIAASQRRIYARKIRMCRKWIHTHGESAAQARSELKPYEHFLARAEAKREELRELERAAGVTKKGERR